MNGFKLISAIKRGLWMIDGQWAEDNMVMIERVLSGHPFDQSSFTQAPSIMADQSFVSYSDYYGWSHAEENSIAVHRIIGPIMHYGVCGPGTSELHAEFVSADRNKNIVGHLFIFDTPGGQADGIKEYAQAIKASAKPKIGMISGGMSASGGVWIMSALDKVFASSDLVEVGSIGAYRTLVDYSEKDKKDGIRQTIIRAEQSKDKNLIYELANAGDKSALAELRNGASFLAGQFIDWVKETRADRLTSDEWSTGKMYSAQEAINLGLIDGIASLEEVQTMFSTSTSVISKNQNMSKMNNIMALAGKDQVTSDELDLANADLTEAGITHVTLVEQSVIDEGARVTTELATANEQLTAANATIATQVATIATHQARITTLEGVIARRAADDNGVATDADPTEKSEIKDEKPKKVFAHNAFADRGIFG